MPDDPYRVLGLTPDATDEQVKQAYRRLAKQYHPDMNPGDPEAARKMNEINAAYDQIKNPPTQTAYQTAYDPFSGWRRAQEQQDASPLQTARSFIRFGSFRDALNILNGVPDHQRTAEWYYLAAVANTQLGNFVLGAEQIRRACELEPGNPVYQRAMQEILSGGASYSDTRQKNYGGGQTDPRCCCAACLLANLCCGGQYLCFPCCC